MKRPADLHTKTCQLEKPWCLSSATTTVGAAVSVSSRWLKQSGLDWTRREPSCKKDLYWETFHASRRTVKSENQSLYNPTPSRWRRVSCKRRLEEPRVFSAGEPGPPPRSQLFTDRVRDDKYHTYTAALDHLQLSVIHRQIHATPSGALHVNMLGRGKVVLHILLTYMQCVIDTGWVPAAEVMRV